MIMTPISAMYKTNGLYVDDHGSVLQTSLFCSRKKKVIPAHALDKPVVVAAVRSNVLWNVTAADTDVLEFD